MGRGPGVHVARERVGRDRHAGLAPHPGGEQGAPRLARPVGVAEVAGVGVGVDLGGGRHDDVRRGLRGRRIRRVGERVVDTRQDRATSTPRRRAPPRSRRRDDVAGIPTEPSGEVTPNRRSPKANTLPPVPTKCTHRRRASTPSRHRVTQGPRPWSRRTARAEREDPAVGGHEPVAGGVRAAAMPTTGATSGAPPIEPRNGASPNEKIPPSAATSQ